MTSQWIHAEARDRTTSHVRKTCVEPGISDSGIGDSHPRRARSRSAESVSAWRDPRAQDPHTRDCTVPSDLYLVWLTSENPFCTQHQQYIKVTVSVTKEHVVTLDFLHKLEIDCS